MSLNPSTTTVIANPAAAAGKVRRQWSRVEAAIKQHVGDVEIKQTEGTGHAIELAEQAVLSGADCLLVIGGDGTTSEVVNGIMRAAPAPGAVTIGVLPFGTGGDFRRVIEHSRDFYSAVEHIGSAASYVVDVGHIELLDDDGVAGDRYFINLASVGMSGIVDRFVNNSSKLLGGKISFLLGVLRGLVAYRPATVRLTADGDNLGEHEVFSVFIGNSQHAGGGMHLAPNALMNDGFFDAHVLPALPMHRALRNLPKLYDGSIANIPEVLSRRFQTLVIEPVGPNKAWWDIDGEAPGAAPSTVRVIPGAIRVLGLRRHVLQPG